MKRRIIGLVAALALALSAVSPASAFVHSIGLYDGTGGSGASCLNWTSGAASLTSGCGANWDNRASSVKFNLLTGQCVAFYLDASYGGTAWYVFGSATGQVYDVPSAYNNAISSFRFGNTVDLGGGMLGCASPWT